MKTRDLVFNTIAAVVVVAAFAYFGSGFLSHIWKMEVGKAAMKMRVDQIVTPAERLWILEQIQAELESNHVGDPDAWSMPLVDLVNRPDTEFKGLSPWRLEMLRRLYIKLKLGTEA